jgi:hypothetical protein
MLQHMKQQDLKRWLSVHNEDYIVHRIFTPEEKAWTINHIVDMAAEPEIIKQIGKKDPFKYWVWLNGVIHHEKSILYRCSKGILFCGYVWLYPESENGYIAHQMFKPGKEHRSGVDEFLEICKRAFWSDCDSSVTHLFAQVPSSNKQAIYVDLKAGFKKIGTIPDYCETGNVDILMLRRK